MPEISVIITTYNRHHFLKEAIKSVLTQSFANFELIVVDDFSLDNPEKTVRSFEDKRIVYIRHNINRGDAVAKNTGIKIARGKYIISLDDDDLMAPWALEELFNKIKDSYKNIGGVYGWSWWTRKNWKTLRFINSKKKGKIFNDIFKDQIFTNILLKKEVFDTMGLYDENLKSNYDYDFYLRISRKYELDFVPRVFFIIRVQENEHLSELSLLHMKSHQEVMQRYLPNSKDKGVLILNFLPTTFYFKLSLFKHKVITTIKIMSSATLRKEIAEIQKELKKQEIRI
jgi:glycosyltransferase involved in cell wall biosynthesis